ncbi:MAG: hypothetical protein IV092_06610 [Burkholderiaceae bacterium]|nr:hypothetical protein [Burkholderiaceae bacterium]
MPQFLYRIQPTRATMLAEGPTEAEAAIIGAHFRYLEQGVADGTVLMAGRTLIPDEQAFGVVVFTAATEEAAAELMRNDPAVSQGVMTAQLFPFRVALWSKRVDASAP